MIAAIIGIAVGLTELWLLSKLTKILLSGSVSALAGLIVLAKLALLAAALFGTALIAKAYLVHMGVGIAAGLMIGALVKYGLQLYRDGKSKKRSQEEE